MLNYKRHKHGVSECGERNGMTVKDTWVKHYRGVDMPHFKYVIKNDGI